MLAIVISSLGFPVIHELRARFTERTPWSLHAKITPLGTAVLLLFGFFSTIFAEWNNPGTLGPLTAGDKLLNSLFHSVTTRTTGYNSVDVGTMREETLAVTYLLMFIGGGSAGTAGGIKITTFVLLGIAVWSEARGERDAALFGRRVSSAIERQALAVALLSIAFVWIGALIILPLTDHPLTAVLFSPSPPCIKALCYQTY